MLLALLAAILLLPPDALAQASAVTSLGAFQGRERNGAILFPHIAYAEPPLGPLRWKRPRPATKARQLPEPVECAHDVADSLGEQQPPLPKSEDCLYLNVWAPKGAKPETKAPVIFLIHGGGLLAGSGLKALYDGSVFARRGYVFVSFNYRLAELGYGPSLEKEQGSLGLLDQGLALRWVRENIEAFGGDPQRIFLMGHSKGAEAVTALVQSGLAGPEVRGGIAFSAPRNFRVGERPQPQKFWPGEQAESWQSILKKKGFLLYVPDLPAYRPETAEGPPFPLLSSSLYDETNGGLESPLYCTVLHFLEQFPPYIHAYNYVWHSPGKEHGAEIFALFREEPFGERIFEHIKAFVAMGKPPRLNPFQKVERPWHEERKVIHVYPGFAFATGFTVPEPAAGEPNSFGALMRMCELSDLTGSKISRAHHWLDRLFRRGKGK